MMFIVTDLLGTTTSYNTNPPLRVSWELDASYEDFAKCSFRTARNEQALIKYCQKDGIVWSHGFPKPIKIIQTLYDWQLRLETIGTGTPNGRTVHWFWEPTGCVGKSAFCKYMVVKHNATVVRGGKLSDIMNIIFNTDMVDPVITGVSTGPSKSKVASSNRRP